MAWPSSSNPSYTLISCLSMSTVREYGTVRRTILYGTVRYWRFEYPYRTFLYFYVIKNNIYLYYRKKLLLYGRDGQSAARLG